MTDDPRVELIGRIQAIRERWHRLVDDVGEERMELPGPMGEWSFKDLASHLTAWRRRTVDRLEAAARGEDPPPSRWPAELGQDEDDPINAWIHEQTRDRPLAEALAAADEVYDDFIAAIEALPAEDLTDPNRFDWLGGEALVEADFGGHLDEHEPAVRRWLGAL